MTPKQIAKASDHELEARGKEMWADAHQHNGMTRKGWNEWHRIDAEQRKRKLT